MASDRQHGGVVALIRLSTTVTATSGFREFYWLIGMSR